MRGFARWFSRSTRRKVMSTGCFKGVRLRVALLACLLLSGGLAAGQRSVLYGTYAGAAKAGVQGSVMSLSNRMLEARWSAREGKLEGSKIDHVFTLEPFQVLTLETRALTSGGKARESRDQ